MIRIQNVIYKILKINSYEDLNKKLIVLQLLNILKVCHNTFYRLR
mgnify:CR=1 FL=1